MDPPNQTANWDGLSDSLWGGLDQHPALQLAIVWPGHAGMRAHSPDDHAIAMEILEELTRTLGDPELTCGRPKQVAVILA